MERNAPCFCGSGKKQKKCHEDILPNSIVGTVIKHFIRMDNQIEMHRISLGIEFVCKKGCSSCCSDYFYTTEAEYLTIRNYLIKTFPKEELSHCIDLGREALDKLIEAFPEEYQKVSLSERDTFNSIFDDKMYLPSFCNCIFLRDDVCLIYPVRPEICRTHGYTEERTCEKAKTLVTDINLCLVPSVTESFLTDVNTYIRKGESPYFLKFKPLFYWFAKDEIFGKHYQAAIHSSREHFFRTLLHIN